MSIYFNHYTIRVLIKKGNIKEKNFSVETFCSIVIICISILNKALFESVLTKR